MRFIRYLTTAILACALTGTAVAASGSQAVVKIRATSLGKVKSIRGALDARRLATELEVDGGIKPENAARVVAAGATVLVAGSAIFEDPDGPVAALRKFKNAVRS